MRLKTGILIIIFLLIVVVLLFIYSGYFNLVEFADAKHILYTDAPTTDGEGIEGEIFVIFRP